ncbi:hypothetical protein [Bradyrhizobium sp. USDA 4486]
MLVAQPQVKRSDISDWPHGAWIGLGAISEENLWVIESFTGSMREDLR